MKRREFIATVTAAGLGAVAAGGMSVAGGDPPLRLRRRALGNTGRALSLVGLGGIVISGVEQSEANEIVRWCWERGVNYFDVAPTYGNAEERLGPALKPFRRNAFLACKTAKRDAAGARAELEQSLRLLQTDHFELYQLHGVTKMEDVETVLGPGGALETLVKAREQGLVSHLGFSAHSVDAALKLLDSFDFHSVLFPLNAVCVENGDFGMQVLDRARARGASFLGLKAMAWQPWPRGAERKYPKCWYQPADDPDLADLLLRYALDQPLVSTVPPGDVRLFRLAVELACRHEPLTDDERGALRERMRDVTPIFRHDA